MMTFIGAVEKIGGEVEHAVEAPFKYAEKLTSLLHTALKDEPELKAGILQLVTYAEAIVADGAADIAANGLNIPADLKTFQDIQTLAGYLKSTFFPLVGNVYSEAKQDILGTVADPSDRSSASAASASSTTAPAVQAGPGLHSVTPA
jgi:hypothetical protein